LRASATRQKPKRFAATRADGAEVSPLQPEDEVGLEPFGKDNGGRVGRAQCSTTYSFRLRRKPASAAAPKRAPKAEVYTPSGLESIASNNMTVLLRHYPGVAPGLRHVRNRFRPLAAGRRVDS
jgi:hypothetical protein